MAKLPAKPKKSKKTSSREASSLQDHLSWRENAVSGVDRSTRRSSFGNDASSSPSSAGGVSAAARNIKVDPDCSYDSSASTSTKKRTAIFKDEVLGRRVKILFDVDTGMDSLTKQWYEGTITGVTLELKKKNGGKGGKSGGKKGKTTAHVSGGCGGTNNLSAIHEVVFDDGDVKWFNLIYWEDRGELEWIGGGDRPTPIDASSEKEQGNRKSEEVGASGAASAAGTKRKRTQVDYDKNEGGLSSTSKKQVKAEPADNNKEALSISQEDEHKSAAAAAAKVVRPESPPHQIIHGKKYYMI